MNTNMLETTTKYFGSSRESAKLRTKIDQMLAPLKEAVSAYFVTYMSHNNEIDLSREFIVLDIRKQLVGLGMNIYNIKFDVIFEYGMRATLDINIPLEYVSFPGPDTIRWSNTENYVDFNFKIVE